MLSSFFRRHSGVDEANQIGKRVIPEQQIHYALAVVITLNGIQPRSCIRREATASIARKVDALTSSEDPLISSHPLNSKAVRNGNDFVGNTTFRWPHPSRSHSENFLVQVESAEKLLAGILGM